MTTIGTTPSEIKQVVKEKYGAIASSPTKKSCCGTGASDVTFMEKGYTADDLADIKIADLGLGCGTPTAYSGLKEGMTILDLGSGAGIDVFIASKQLGSTGKAIGVDMTEQMVTRAKENALRLGVTNVEFRLGEIENLPVETSTIDRVISNCVINLVPDKSVAFKEIHRTLKPGGSFIISDIVTTGTMPEHIRHDAELYAGCVSGAMDMDAYISIITKAGFNNIEVMEKKSHPKFSTDAFGLYSITIKGIK